MMGISFGPNATATTPTVTRISPMLNPSGMVAAVAVSLPLPRARV